METESAQGTKTTLVLGGTGKTGRRVVERLEARGLPARAGSRSGEAPFDWEDWATGQDIRFVLISVEEYASVLAEQDVPAEFMSFLTYLFGEVLDGCNAHLADGIRRALGREPKD